MPHIDYTNREIHFKIVYFGPGMGGKTTNLVSLHQMLDEHMRSEMVMLDTVDERTIFFDFLPLDLGSVEGYTIRFNLYTVPGQIYYETSRRLILDNSDGVVFVVDSDPDRIDHNIFLFEMMQESLEYYGHDPATFPLVLQYNKRDLLQCIPLGFMEKEFNLVDVPVYQAVANKGEGVMETLREISTLVIERFQF